MKFTLLSIIYFFTREIYYTSIIYSLALSVGAILLVCFKISKSHYSAVLGMIALLFSKAFIDYSTSGLENPLTHLLLALFFFVYIKENPNPVAFFYLCFVASLCALNRLDTILFFIPAIILYIWKLGNMKKSLISFLGGFSPLILWELFSLFYYGFPFPNTAYGKLNTGISTTILIKHGLLYLKDSLINDPLTLIIILMSIVFPFVKREKRNIPIAMGIFSYAAYIVLIGGCYMSGRYLSAPFFLAVVLIFHKGFSSFGKRYILLFVLIVMIGFIAPNTPVLSGKDYGKNRDWSFRFFQKSIVDERGRMYQNYGLLPVMENSLPTFGYELEKAKHSLFAVRGAIGHFSFDAGPAVHVFDGFALTEPLLARLPVIETEDIWIGHFGRPEPPGYIDTLKTGTNRIHNRDIALFYSNLANIIRGDLLSVRRLVEIWNFNTGKYDDLVDILYSNPKKQWLRILGEEQRINE